MKKDKRVTKKKLKNSMAAIMQVYLDGLTKKKSEQLNKYLDKKLGRVVDYYMNQLKKKQKRNLVLPSLPEKFVAPSSIPTVEAKLEAEAVFTTVEQSQPMQ
jgi:hypothetical protein